MVTLDAIEIFVQKCIRMLTFIFPIVILVLVIKYTTGLYRNSKKETSETCEIESKLEFEGNITEYNGQGYKTRPIAFIIRDSTIKIPRYNNEFNLFVGDTIKKIRGSHTYFIKRCYLSEITNGKRLDTLSFNCH
jgi:hypothetical protein